MNESLFEKRFWRYWLGGILLFAVMIVLSTIRDTVGISEHQAAATAARVDAIQRQWQADGVIGLVQFGMVIDLIFIGVYSWGAWNGGNMMLTETAPAVRRIGGLVMAASLIFMVTDYAETICQFIQLAQFKGNDSLAGIAAAAQPVKMIAFLTTFIGLLAALMLRRMARPPA